jgi:hypothetical protein
MVRSWSGSMPSSAPGSRPSFQDNVKCVFDSIEEVHRAMHGGRLDEKVIAQPSAHQSRAESCNKKGPGSTGGKEAHRQYRSRLRQLRAY